MPDVDPQIQRETGRYRKLARLENYLAGTQYDGLTDWYDTTCDKPLRERRPCVIYPLPKASVNQAVRFTIGEGKFPKLNVESVEPDDAHAPQFAINEEDARSFTRALDDMVSRSQLRSAMRVMMRRGLSCGTGVVVLSVHRGRFCFEHPRAKDCTPVFENDNPELPVKSLTWSYLFDCEEFNEKRERVVVRRAFRRDYTETEVVEYEHAVIKPGSNKPIAWVEKDRTPHELGFCPVVWTRNLPDECGSDIDGVAIYDGLLDELDALNFALSQRHKGIEVLGTPQPFETGVADDDGPGAVGRTAAPVALDKRAPYSPANKVRTQSARKTGAEHLWSYKGDGVELGLLETTGKAFEVASAHVADIRSRLLEAMDVILLDPTSVAGKGDMSAKALALMYAPMLALVDELREWWWEHAIQPILSMMLRAISALGAGVLVKGAARIAALLKKREIVIDSETIWEPPGITPLWGEYFAPSAEEVFKTVQSASLAMKSGLVSRETGTRFIANMFAVPNVEDEIDDTDDDAAEASVDTDSLESTEPVAQPDEPERQAPNAPEANE